MKRRTFLKLLGLSAAPTLPLVGTDLGAALTKTEKSDTEAVIRVDIMLQDSDITSGIEVFFKKPLFFKIPVFYEKTKNSFHCLPVQKTITMDVDHPMRLLGVYVRPRKDIRDSFKGLGLDIDWMNTNTPAADLPAGTLTLVWNKQGLYTIAR